MWINCVLDERSWSRSRSKVARLRTPGHGDHWRLVQCGSSFLSDAESQYAMVELKLLTVVWALKKCRFYLQGLPHFEDLVDHRPLLPILNHFTLDAIENSRLQRLKKTSLFN